MLLLIQATCCPPPTRAGPARTFQVKRLAAVVAELLQQEPEDGGGGAAVLLPLGRGFVVEQDGVRLAALDEALLVLVVGDDGADGQVAFLEPPQHQARDGQVDGRLDVRRLEELVRPAVEQQQRAATARLQLLLQPLHALPRHRCSHESPGRAAPDVIFHEDRQGGRGEKPKLGWGGELERPGGIPWTGPDRRLRCLVATYFNLRKKHGEAEAEGEQKKKKGGG